MRIHSLTTRFVLTLLLSTVVPFLVFTALARNLVRERQAVLVDGVLSVEAERSSARLSSSLEQTLRECALFGSAAQRALLGEISLADFRDEVEFAPAFHAEYQLVVLADQDGTVRAVVDGLGQDEPTAEARQALRPDSVRGTPWFDALVAGRAATGQIWLDRHLSPFMHRDPTKSSRDPADFVYGLAFVVQGQGRLVGVVLALRPWQRVQAEVDSWRERLGARYPSASALIWDGHGRVLAHTDRAQYAADGAAPELAAAALEPSGATAVGDNDGTWRAGIARLAPVAPGIDWRCAVVAAGRELFADSRYLGTLLLGVTGGVAAILLLWAWFASRAILRPVRRLADATERLAAGDTEVRVRAHGRGELAELGRAFNQMAGEIAAGREQLRTAARQSAWAEMARQVAHEIKNPLTPIRMSAQLLLRANRAKDPRLPELVERLANTVQQQTDTLAKIATDFRQFAGEPVRELAPARSGELLADVERDFAATIESGVALRFECDDADLTVRVDRHEIRRVFLNLVQNALHAAGAHGTVVVRAQRDGGRARFTVTDSGPGIDDAARARLFEPYFTTRSSGTGLGLAICKRVVEAHGGTIELTESAPGRTVFSFWLA